MAFLSAKIDGTPVEGVLKRHAIDRDQRLTLQVLVIVVYSHEKCASFDVTNSSGYDALTPLACDHRPIVIWAYFPDVQTN